MHCLWCYINEVTEYLCQSQPFHRNGKDKKAQDCSTEVEYVKLKHEIKMKEGQWRPGCQDLKIIYITGKSSSDIALQLFI